MVPYAMNVNSNVPHRAWSGRTLIWVLASSLFLPTGCGTPISSLNSLAKAGQINSAAPVRAGVQISISAPAQTVWALLVNAQDWTAWNSHIQRVDATGTLHQGMIFAWETGGTKITSRVQLAETNRRLAWTGTAFSAKAVHVWELDSGPGGQTIVRMQESLDGPFIAHFVSSTELVEADTEWLAALKKVAEQHP